MGSWIWGCLDRFWALCFALVLSDGKGVYGMDGGQKVGWQRWEIGGISTWKSEL